MVESKSKLTSSYFVIVSTENKRKAEVILNGRRLLPFPSIPFPSLSSCDHPHSDSIHYLCVGSEEVLLIFFRVIDSYQCS